MTINYHQCPICNSANLVPYLAVNDFSVTQQQFNLVQCTQCTLLVTQNIPDEQSIAPYYNFEDYISHTDTNKSFLHKVYHKVRSRTLRSKLKWIQKATNLQQGALLDIGCGTGAFLNYANNNGWQVKGIEADETARAKAMDLYGIQANGVEALFTLPNNSYDAITLWHVLEHIHQLDAYMQQINKLLTSKGKLFIAVPNFTSYDAQYYKKYWAAYDVPRHLYHYSPKAMEQLAARYGFVIERYQPMWYDSFYVSLLSEKYKKGSSIRAILIGFWANIKALFNAKKCSSVTYILRKV